MLQPATPAGNQSVRAPSPASGAPTLVWAGDPDAAPDHDNVILWHGAVRRAGVRSITEFIETHAEEVRGRYLAWVHDLGETRVRGRRLQDRFTLSDGHSLWPHALFVEQSTWRQYSLETLLKVFAFELLIEQECPVDVSFAGSDHNLSEVLEALCRRRGIAYRWTRLGVRRTMTLRSLARALPRPIQGFLSLARWVWISQALQPRPEPPRQTARPHILICGPFSNHNATGPAAKEFVSRFWGSLPRLLVEAGYEVHWLHYFHAHDKVPGPRAARTLLTSINNGAGGNSTHSLVESYLPLGDIAKIGCRWVAVAIESVLVGLSLRARFRNDPHESYWPLIRDDWARALRGTGAVESLFYIECFERALRTLPRQDECIYLMENQTWERALALAWHKRAAGRLTGVAHSTVRFWDLRYHCDPRRYGREHRGYLPAPDVVVLNGPAAREEYLATSPEREPVVECEALRYLHLVPGTPRALADLGRGRALTLLILGDYTRERTDTMLRIVETARRQARSPLEIHVKWHPACPADPQILRDAAFKLVEDPVAQLVPAAHWVLASNTTSAALEAYVSGGRVLVFDDRSGVNYSPLRRVPGVVFIRDAEDLCNVIEAFDAASAQEVRHTDGFFNIDPNLACWRRYFGPSGGMPAATHDGRKYG